MVHRASLKLISLHLASVSSLLRTIVSRSNFTAARIDGDVPTRSRYWYMRRSLPASGRGHAGRTSRCWPDGPARRDSRPSAHAPWPVDLVHDLARMDGGS